MTYSPCHDLATMARSPDEAPDISLADKLVFRPRGLMLQTFTRDEIGHGKTPDRRVLRVGELVALSEIKSPRDDWLDAQLDAAPPGAIVGGARSDPTFNRIARHIQKAARQFDAVNSARGQPNILVFVNHDDHSGYRDLRETLTGDFHAGTGKRFATMKGISDGIIASAKQRIDLYVWIDGRRRRIQGYVINDGASPDHRLQVCSMFGLDPSQIQR
jgi:hypothetical protein